MNSRARWYAVQYMIGICFVIGALVLNDTGDIVLSLRTIAVTLILIPVAITVYSTVSKLFSHY